MFRFTGSSSNKDMLGPTLQRHQVQPEQRQIDLCLLQASETRTEDLRMIDLLSTWTPAAAQAVVLPQLPEQTSRKQGNPEIDCLIAIGHWHCRNKSIAACNRSSPLSRKPVTSPASTTKLLFKIFHTHIRSLRIMESWW